MPFVYKDATGVPVMSVLGKKVSHADANGAILDGFPAGSLPLYRADSLGKFAGEIVLVTSEGVADALAAQGLQGATTYALAGKAGSWRPEYLDALRGRDVVIVHGGVLWESKWAAARRKDLRGVAATLRVIVVPTAGTVVDWLRSGGNATQLQQLMTAAPKCGTPGSLDFALGKIEKICTMPSPTYRVEVESKFISVAGLRNLLDPKFMKVAIGETIDRVPGMPSADEWEGILNPLIKTAAIVELGDDDEHSLLCEKLGQALRDAVHGKTVKDLENGRVVELADGRKCFTLEAAVKLGTRFDTRVTLNSVKLALRNLGCTPSIEIRLDNQRKRVWMLPLPPQTEDATT